MDTFNKYTNVRYVLDSLNKGGIIRQVFGRFVQVYSVIAGLALLSFWIKTFSALEYMEFFQGAALLIWQIFFPVAAFLCLKAVSCEVETSLSYLILNLSYRRSLPYS